MALIVSLHHVEDTAAADHDESSYFRLVEDILSHDGQNRYQQDIAATSVDLATSLSYRVTTDHGDGIFERMPSPTIINRRVRKHGGKLKLFLPTVSVIQRLTLSFLTAKCYSQDDDQTLKHFATRSLDFTIYPFDYN